MHPVNVQAVNVGISRRVTSGLIHVLVDHVVKISEAYHAPSTISAGHPLFFLACPPIPLPIPPSLVALTLWDGIAISISEDDFSTLRRNLVSFGQRASKITGVSLTTFGRGRHC